MMRKRNASAPPNPPEPAPPPGSIAAQLIALSEAVPKKVWEKLPKDGARNLDHYLYGAPKR